MFEDSKRAIMGCNYKMADNTAANKMGKRQTKHYTKN